MHFRRYFEISNWLKFLTKYVQRLLEHNFQVVFTMEREIPWI